MRKIKNNTKGITLITLVVTIVMLLILASVATYSGIDAIKTAELNRFITELKIMQTEVNDLYDKYKNNGTAGDYTGEGILDIGKDMSLAQDKANKVFQANASGITDQTGYKYFDSETIKTLGIEDISGEFFINIQKRKVISCDGIENNKKIYYTLEQLPNSLYNVEYNENTNIPDFNIKTDLIGENKYKITIEPIYEGNVQKWDVKYQLDGESYWNTSDELTFNIEKAGNYNIKIQNGDIQSEQKTQYLGYVTSGMVLHYDGIINTRVGSNKASEIKTWYDLSGKRNDGAIRNGCTWNEDSLNFDGVDDYVSLGVHNYENVTLQVVVSNNVINTTETEYIVNYESGGYGLKYQSKKNSFAVNTGSYVSKFSDNSLEINKLYSLSGSYNQNQLVLFENGIKHEQELEGSIKVAQSNTSLCLGTNPYIDEGISNWLNGKIYSVRVYNRALTDEEVAINYEMDKSRFNIE